MEIGDKRGSVAIVTGAAKGIGAATARLLAQRGYKVAVNYLSDVTAAEALVTDLRRHGAEALAVRADVRDPAAVAAMVEQTLSTFGRIDALVSNARMSWVAKPFLELRWEEFHQKLDDELRAAFTLTQAVAPVMVRQGRGRLVYVSSSQSKRPAVPGAIAHGASKAALVTFVKYVAHELGPKGITANVVSPGMVETLGTAKVPPEAKQKVAELTPLRRIAQPEDVARVVAFFASEDSGFVTGSSAPVDGGFYLD